MIKFIYDIGIFNLLDILTFHDLKYFAYLTKSLYSYIYTVNSEIFERTLFSQIALKDIFTQLKTRD